MGVGRLFLAISGYFLVAIGKELCYRCVGPWHTARRCLPPSWWGVLLCFGYSAALLGLLPGSLVVSGCAYYSLSSLFLWWYVSSVKLIVEQVRILNWLTLNPLGLASPTLHSDVYSGGAACMCIIRNNGHSLFSLFIDISGDCLVEINIRTAVLDTWLFETLLSKENPP